METLQSLSTLRYTTTMNSYWYKVPNLKLYDIMAIRFENTSASIYSWEGYQDAYDSSAAGGASYEYHYSEADSPNNYKKINNAGIGVIMNLKDSSSQFNLLLTVTTNGNPNKVYGTYQHENRSGLSLANAKSFTFGNGLGGVLNHSYSSYYDGMQGVVNDYFLTQG